MIKKSAIVAIVWVVLALGRRVPGGIPRKNLRQVKSLLDTWRLQETVFMVMARKFFIPRVVRPAAGGNNGGLHIRLPTRSS